jgi:hypothetical protein
MADLHHSEITLRKVSPPNRLRANQRQDVRNLLRPARRASTTQLERLEGAIGYCARIHEFSCSR